MYMYTTDHAIGSANSGFIQPKPGLFNQVDKGLQLLLSITYWAMLQNSVVLAKFMKCRVRVS